MWLIPVRWIAEEREGAEDWGAFPDERRELADHIADNAIDLTGLTWDGRELMSYEFSTAGTTGADR